MAAANAASCANLKLTMLRDFDKARKDAVLKVTCLRYYLGHFVLGVASGGYPHIAKAGGVQKHTESAAKCRLGLQKIDWWNRESDIRKLPPRGKQSPLISLTIFGVNLINLSRG